ncbi:MAG: glutamate 5-kinase [Bacteroidales bacterium]|nr:glutamate 5-kinase [Bacteroidales bacterium]
MESAGFSEAVRKGLAVSTGKRRRIVVKVGSNVLTRSDHALDTTRVSAIVDQIVEARRGGCDVVLVTSGAVACGRALIPLNNKLDEVQQRQLYSAVGQVRLMDLYYKLFMDYGINVGQVLTMRENFTGKRQYTNQKNCMETMLQSGVLPVVNENDTVSITELMFTDNDELSGLVAEMVGADTLILLTNVDGVYDGDPADPASKVIRSIRVGEDASRFIQPSKSSGGRGGMQSKYRIAARLAASGTRVIIANGTRERILTDLLTDPDHTVHTEFTPE